nr:hypothetical protein PHAVU_001G104000g [Ipomoea batatas]
MDLMDATLMSKSISPNNGFVWLHKQTTQAPGISDHTGGLLHHLLPDHVELELHVYLTGGDECMHPRLLGMLHRLPSPINIPLIAPRKAAYDRNVHLTAEHENGAHLEENPKSVPNVIGIEKEGPTHCGIPEFLLKAASLYKKTLLHQTLVLCNWQERK